MGIRAALTAPRSPWQNGHVERANGTIRRECLDHVVIVSEIGLYRVLRQYMTNASNPGPPRYTYQQNTVDEFNEERGHGAAAYSLWVSKSLLSGGSRELDEIPAVGDSPRELAIRDAQAHEGRHAA
ncbi:MAG: integrase core domain-containing protein [Vicinamibacterales bacterium]